MLTHTWYTEDAVRTGRPARKMGEGGPSHLEVLCRAQPHPSQQARGTRPSRTAVSAAHLICVGQVDPPNSDDPTTQHPTPPAHPFSSGRPHNTASTRHLGTVGAELTKTWSPAPTTTSPGPTLLIPNGIPFLSLTHKFRNFITPRYVQEEVK